MALCNPAAARAEAHICTNVLADICSYTNVLIGTCTGMYVYMWCKGLSNLTHHTG